MANIFEKMDPMLYTLSDLGNLSEARADLGEMMPVEVYRLFQHSMRNVLFDLYGKDMMVETFRAAGEAAGADFANTYLDLELDLDNFMTQLAKSLEKMKIGILKIESFDVETGHAVLTVSQDLDCSGLPVTGETVCNYDEGFIAGILEAYTGKKYIVTEIACWATGDKTCRFDAVVADEADMDEE